MLALCVAVVAVSLAILLLCFIAVVAFLLSSCVCKLLIKFMMTMMMIVINANNW